MPSKRRKVFDKARVAQVVVVDAEVVKIGSPFLDIPQFRFTSVNPRDTAYLWPKKWLITTTPTVFLRAGLTAARTGETHISIWVEVSVGCSLRTVPHKGVVFGWICVTYCGSVGICDRIIILQIRQAWRAELDVCEGEKVFITYASIACQETSYSEIVLRVSKLVHVDEKDPLTSRTKPVT